MTRRRANPKPARRPIQGSLDEQTTLLLETIRIKRAELQVRRRKIPTGTKQEAQSRVTQRTSQQARVDKALPSTPIPEIPLSQLVVEAKIDYLKVDGFAGKPVLPSSIAAKSEFTRTQINPAWQLTIHDPTAAEIVKLHELLGDAHIAGLEIAVDFTPRSDATLDREALLTQTFRALAARFRPDEVMIHGAGLKGAIGAAGIKLVPFHNRLPKPQESLVYGHRDEGQNAKLYLKRTDQQQQLPADQHRVRLETTITSFGGYELDFKQLTDLAGGRLRGTFAKVFRIIDRAEVRRPLRLSPEELSAIQAEVATAWARGGVNAIEQPPMPPEASALAKKAASGRYRLVPLTKVLLKRDVATNAAIGEALRRLDRKLVRAWGAT